MQLSKYATYGIIVMQELRQAESPLTQYQLADVTGVTHTYIQQVLIRLIKAKLVGSVRGPNGGYVLADRKRKATVMDVVQAVSMAKENGAEGNERFREVVKKVDDRILKALSSVQVDKL